MAPDSPEVEPYLPGDHELRSILGRAKTVAIVGLSSDPAKYSNEVGSYLQKHGYRVIPVNPNETEALGEKAYPSLLDVPDQVDAVDVFRKAEKTPEIARQAVQIGATVLWLQDAIVSDEARRIAEDAGLDVVMGVCIKTTHRRLGV
jgi:predicted CoA-binding protein